MTSRYKIPKKQKQQSDSDSNQSPPPPPSPLSHLHGAPPQLKDYGKTFNGRRACTSDLSTNRCRWSPQSVSHRCWLSSPHNPSVDSSAWSSDMNSVATLDSLPALPGDGQAVATINQEQSVDSEESSMSSGARKPWIAHYQDSRGEERRRRMVFTEGKYFPHSLKKWRRTTAEPIILSSEEEEEREGVDNRDGTKTVSQSASTCWPEDESHHREALPPSSPGAEGHHHNLPPPPPPHLELSFTSLHVGLRHAQADGRMMITESGITLPVKVSGGGEAKVTVVASQLFGYGLWDGGVAQGGTLLTGWEGPAPSLLLLWVTEAQALLLQKELLVLRQSSVLPGGSCDLLLLVLKEQLQELQAALLASILDMKEYQRGRSSTFSSPLDWTDGILLFHSCPPPLDQHLLTLIGHSTTDVCASSAQRNRKSSLRSSCHQQLPLRLLQYPPPPCRGRISVTREDLARLNAGEFLNDVIIDFYLKYLLLEGGGSVAKRCHVFSSFFFKQLSRRPTAKEDHAPSVSSRHIRHQRVKTWTRHMDIFHKDFLFVPVNQEAHWFLAVVCFPGLENVQHQDFKGSSERTTGKQRQQPPECTELGCHSGKVLKRPCILVMDSLKLSGPDNVCRLLRDYLQVEWEVRRGTPRAFTPDTMRSSSCRVPQQDNSSDCGLYLLQYVQSFLQNPVVHLELPLCLENWFPRQQVRQKREEIRRLIMRLHQSQSNDDI